MFLVHDQGVLLLGRHSEHGTRSRVELFQLGIYKTLIKRLIFDDSDEIKMRIHCYRPFSTFWNISGDRCSQAFYSWRRQSSYLLVFLLGCITSGPIPEVKKSVLINDWENIIAYWESGRIRA